MRRLATLLLAANAAAAGPAEWSGDPFAQVRLVLPAASRVRGIPLAADGSDYLVGAASPPDCSGSVVRLARSDDAPAVVLTNGHCWRLNMPRASFYANRPWRRPITVFARDRKELAFWSRRVLYATQTGTDVALVELAASYATLLRAGVRVYELSPEPPAPGESAFLVSGLFKSVELCRIAGTAARLRENGSELLGSRIIEGCRGIDGMSGSPLVSPAGPRIVAIFSTAHEGTGPACSNDNPCEIDEAGRARVHKGRLYAQRVDGILGCLDGDGNFDLKAPGCGLFGAGR